MDLKEIIKEVELIASETGAFIMKESEEFQVNFTRTKGIHDFVSYVDLGAEKMLVERLGNLIPEAGFHVEEGTSVKKGSKYCWIVDPLDGTTNFLHKLHPFAISIALSKCDEIIAGVVYEAGGAETFTAWKNGGAWLNGKRIYVSKASHLSDSLIATGFPYSDFSNLSSYLVCMEYLMKNSQGVRRMGSAAIDLAYVACGRYEAFFEYGLKLWDIAAGTILIKEAGGKVSDFYGNEKEISGLNIIASNSLLFPEFHEIVSKFMASI
jgi:myo-inositol-1(or 4)-monophosphatase